MERIFALKLLVATKCKRSSTTNSAAGLFFFLIDLLLFNKALSLQLDGTLNYNSIKSKQQCATTASTAVREVMFTRTGCTGRTGKAEH